MKALFAEVYQAGGMSQEAAWDKANKTVPSILPEEYSESEIEESGSTRYDKFYKSDGKYYHGKSTYNAKEKKWSTITTEIKDFEKYFSTQEEKK